MTKSNVITHAETVRDNAEYATHQAVATYRDMLAQADRMDAQGNHERASQARRNAAEYYDTRLGQHGRNIVDAEK